MNHKTLSLYVHCLEGGCEDAGRIDLEGYTLISDERLYDLEAAEKDANEQARMNGMGSERELALMAKLEAAEKERDALRAEVNVWRRQAEAYWAKIEQMEKQEPVAQPAPSAPEGWIQRGVAELEAIRNRQDDDTLLDDRTLIERIGKAMLAATPEAKP